MDFKGLTFPRAVIFDWDNTLVDSWGAITEALNTARATFGLETWTVEEARVKSARALRDSFPEWFGENWEKARDIFYDRFDKVHIERIRVMKGAQEILDFLNEEKIPCFVVSNKKNVYLKAEADYLGWTAKFHNLVGSFDAKRDKPARDPVDLALNSAGLRGDDPGVWFVGDTHADVECALLSGTLPVIVFNVTEAKRLGIKLFFSDCQSLKTALYNWSKCKTL